MTAFKKLIRVAKTSRNKSLNELKMELLPHMLSRDSEYAQDLSEDELDDGCESLAARA